MTLATRIAVMKGGVLQQLGTPYEVYNRPANLFVAGFMGSPRMNLAKARLAGSGRELSLDIQAGDRPRVTIPLPPQSAAVQGYAGRDVIAGIRAEAISYMRPGMTPIPEIQQVVTAHVEVIEPTGADTLVVLEVGDAELTARLDPDLDLKPGQDARFLVDLSKLVCFDPSTEAAIV
jgi:multiple sugar transport system ATP-binding protein